MTPSGISGESSSEISVFAQYRWGRVTLNEHHFGLLIAGDDAKSDSNASLDASLIGLQSPYIKYFPAVCGGLPPPTNNPKPRRRARCERRNSYIADPSGWGLHWFAQCSSKKFWRSSVTTENADRDRPAKFGVLLDLLPLLLPSCPTMQRRRKEETSLQIIFS